MDGQNPSPPTGLFEEEGDVFPISFCQSVEHDGCHINLAILYL